MRVHDDNRYSQEGEHICALCQHVHVCLAQKESGTLRKEVKWRWRSLSVSIKVVCWKWLWCAVILSVKMAQIRMKRICWERAWLASARDLLIPNKLCAVYGSFFSLSYSFASKRMEQFRIFIMLVSLSASLGSYYDYDFYSILQGISSVMKIFSSQTQMATSFSHS